MPIRLQLCDSHMTSLLQECNIAIACGTTDDFST